jgi:hypothetical protein
MCFSRKAKTRTLVGLFKDWWDMRNLKERKVRDEGFYFFGRWLEIVYVVISRG